jgi:hypothetical protein
LEFFLYLHFLVNHKFDDKFSAVVPKPPHQSKRNFSLM